VSACLLRSIVGKINHQTHRLVPVMLIIGRFCLLPKVEIPMVLYLISTMTRSVVTGAYTNIFAAKTAFVIQNFGIGPVDFFQKPKRRSVYAISRLMNHHSSRSVSMCRPYKVGETETINTTCPVPWDNPRSPQSTPWIIASPMLQLTTSLWLT